jgi:membrane protease YdiL (CAAX protease family)
VVSTIVGLVAVAVGAGDPAEDSESLTTIVLTALIDAVLVGAAVYFASLTLRPKPWHFGLRRTRFWPAVGWAALGLLAFVVFVTVYGAIVQPDAEQSVTQDLGLREGMATLVLGGILVVVVAPVAEEVFFRGFFYRSLRSSLGIWSAAAITGVLFGLIHIDPTSVDTIQLVPVLAFLGFVFCLVYERTGSLYPVIALHSLNNVLAFGVQTSRDEAWIVGGALGLVAVTGCVLLPRFAWRTAPAAY